jgi:hypothetical protein
METGAVPDNSKVHIPSKAQMEVACTSAKFSTMPTSTWCKHLVAELSLEVNHCKPSKSIITQVCIHIKQIIVYVEIWVSCISNSWLFSTQASGILKQSVKISDKTVLLTKLLHKQS